MEIPSVTRTTDTGSEQLTVKWRLLPAQVPDTDPMDGRVKRPRTVLQEYLSPGPSTLRAACFPPHLSLLTAPFYPPIPCLGQLHSCPRPWSGTVKGSGSLRESRDVGQTPEMWETLSSSAYERGGGGSEGEIKGKESEGTQPGKDHGRHHDISPAVQRRGQGGLRNLDASHRTKPPGR